jgi:hypothetical protein
MRARITRLAVVMLVAAGGFVPLRAAVADTRPEAAVAPLGLLETLKANPGSVRTGENTVLLKPGLMVRQPSTGEMGTQSLGQCPAGWLCAWVDTNYRGAMYGIRHGDCVNFLYWWYDPSSGATIYHASGDAGPGWKPWINSISSVYLLPTTNPGKPGPLWAWFNSPRNNESFGARRGSPSPYVGNKWNDSLVSACAG